MNKSLPPKSSHINSEAISTVTLIFKNFSINLAAIQPAKKEDPHATILIQEIATAAVCAILRPKSGVEMAVVAER